MKKIIMGSSLVLLCATLLVIFLNNLCRPIDIYFSNVEPVSVYEPLKNDPPLKIAMISVLNHKDAMIYQKQLANIIGKKLGRSVVVLHRRSYAEINALLSKGNADIALLSTGAYCVYGKKEGFSLLVMQQRNGLPYYYGYIIASANGNINRLEDLKQKTFAYVDPLSYSGYLGLQIKLNEIGENKDEYFSLSYFTYSHAESIRQVATGEVDGAVIDSLAYDYLMQTDKEMISKIKIIETLPPMGTGPFVARKNLQNQNDIKEILLHIHEDPEAKEALDHLLIEKFIVPQISLYRQFTPEDWGKE